MDEMFKGGASFGGGGGSVDDVDMQPVRYRPDGIESLTRQTKFSRKELQLIYRGFKQECPSGVVDEDKLRSILDQFFPLGDSSQWARCVFRALDKANIGQINFVDLIVSLSVMSRGSMDERLQWIFNLYDLNRDGHISRGEMLEVVGAIYAMLGNSTEPLVERRTAEDHVDRVFRKLDLNQDGIVTIDEFMDYCSKNEEIVHGIKVFNVEFNLGL